MTTKNKQAARFSSPPRSRHPSSSISIDGEGFGACPHPESRIWAAVAVAGGAAASCRWRIDPENADANGGWPWSAIFLDRRGRKRLTQRWQGLALAGGDGRSHGSRGHHGDGVLCWSTSWFFGFGREERWKTVGRAMMTSQELSFVKWNYFLITVNSLNEMIVITKLKYLEKSNTF